MFKLSVLASAVAVALSAMPAHAVVTGGGVTGGQAASQGGSFQILDPMTAFTVGNDSFDNPNFYAFKEGQNATANTTISVDVGTDISAGQMFSSHYVFFDPKDKTTLTGFVDFSAPIYGIVTDEATLAASDTFGHNKVTYLVGAARGLEAGDYAMIDPTNPSRMLFSSKASKPGDYLRVLTQASNGQQVAPVPVPAGFFLMLGAIAGLGFMRKSKSA